ncbi:type VI secretion system baseplate subunit TssK [Botrimarina mediterranea]|uniref:Type VI secretion protein n=1 Tax=Botrimarina mediterranea TaxID=2528022 RepID=A0A518K890_9BACT|nr:type VI secretion system baseplate subunit TssK [Botrimarina mediterranea]QDV74005.1 hypothetical protein Spa11_22040 [Botrimarina mediterranea]QDV78635.1 hypothetical protein K2D_22420 [Planctomycetes bacterium K2D]
MHDLPIHWHEGMFLTPQHFQAADRWQARARSIGSRWDNHYNWGVRSVEIDTDALRNGRLVVRSLQARMPDGELLCFPEDGVLPIVDLRESLRRNRTARVELALPLAKPNQREVTEDAALVSARSVVELRDAVDCNTGAGVQSIPVLRPNARLLVTGDDQAGYQTLSILQVRRSEGANAEPELDPEFIPPLLACDAWAPLQVGVLLRLLERIERKADVLASQAAGRGLDFDSAGQGERLLLEQVRVLNEAIGVLSIDVAAQGVAPLLVYRELARIVGKLSAFAHGMRSRVLPAYDHDDLARCFFSARREIEALLSEVVEPSYQERQFIADKATLAVDVDALWLEPSHRLLVGVQSSAAPDDVQRLLTAGRSLKVGASDRVDDIFMRGESGLALTRIIHVPRALPVRPGLEYYEIGVDQSPSDWLAVGRSMSLAVRFAEHLVGDQPADRNEIVLNDEGKTFTLSLSLFALPNTTAGRINQRDVTPAELTSV